MGMCYERESSGGDRSTKLTVWYSSCVVQADVPLVAVDSAINQGLSKLYLQLITSKMTNK